MPIFPTPEPWKLTTLSAGQLAGNTFSCNIPSLSASTIYEYRSYMVIDGVPFYGNILTGCTSAVPTQSPSVSTGCAYCVYDTGMRLSGSSVTNKGGLSIAEYGVIYTQNSTYGNSSCMVYEAYPSKVLKKSYLSDISVGTTFFTGTVPQVSIIGLNPSTVTYYRAFAKNSTGTGYGVIKTQTTNPTPVTTFAIAATISWTGTGTLPLNGFGGSIALKQGPTTIETESILGIRQLALVNLTGTFGQEYEIDLNGLTAYANGMAIVSNLRWRRVSSAIWSYNKFVVGVESPEDSIVVEINADAPF